MAWINSLPERTLRTFATGLLPNRTRQDAKRLLSLLTEHEAKLAALENDPPKKKKRN